MTIELDLNSLDLNSDLVEIKDLQIEDLLDFARYGELDALEAIFESDYIVKLSAVDEHKTSLLHMVAANGHYECAKLLLSLPEVREKTLNSTNTEGHTPLHWAAFNSQVTLVRLLLEHGANFNIKNFADRTPFDEAVARELFDVTETIIEFLEKSQNNQDPADSSETINDEAESDREDMDTASKDKDEVII